MGARSKVNKWEEDKRWSDRYLPEIKRHLGEFLIGEPKHSEEDWNHNTDLIVLELKAVRIACRVRKDKYREKYGEEFVVGGMRNQGGGFVPDVFWRQRAGSIPQTSYFFAHPSADPHYVFRVFVTRQENSYQIAEIRDTYAWRTLREQLQEYAINYFSEALDIDIKVDVRLTPHGSFRGFPR